VGEAEDTGMRESAGRVSLEIGTGEGDDGSSGTIEGGKTCKSVLSTELLEGSEVSCPRARYLVRQYDFLSQ
jgi:hypothetical protein